MENFSKGLMCLSTSGNYTGTVEKNSPEHLIVDEFFSTVPVKNFDLCIISTRTKTH